MARDPGIPPDQIELKETLRMILKNAVTALKGGAGVIATWDEAERRFAAQVSFGLDSAAMAQLQPLLKEAAPDLASSRQSFALLSDLRPGLGLPYSEENVLQNPIIALPLRIAGRSIGLIYVLRPADNAAFSGVDQPILAAFAEQAAIAVENARLAHLLAEEKSRAEAIIENSGDGIISVDSRGRLVGFNRAMEALTGYSRSEVLGKECSRVLWLRDWEGKSLCALDCPLLKARKSPLETYELRGKMRTKNGPDLDVSIVYSVILGAEGRPTSVVGNVRDISKYRQLESLRETFLATLGHELQTPLSIIKGYTSTLARADGKWDSVTLQQGLNIIEEESDRLSRVMNRLLLAARISTGTSVLKKEPVDLSAIARSVVRRLQSTTSVHVFEVDFGHDFPPVQADPQLIEEVLTNLVENAIKYSPAGGRITVSGKFDAKEVTVEVADEGIGIPPEETLRIFERFHRVDTGPARTIKGIGLGLYLSRTILEAHGGTIEVSSQPGKGSRFFFTLPL